MTATAPQRSGVNRAPARAVKGPQTLDSARLLAWLDFHAAAGSPVRRAIYAGTAARIRRGDFNTQEEQS